MLHDNIKTLCKAAGIQLKDLADRLNVTRQTLHRIITGTPNLDTIERTAAALNVPAWILLHPDPMAALQMEKGPTPGRLIIIDQGTGRRWTIQEETPGPAALPPHATPADHPGTKEEAESPEAQEETRPKRKRGRPKKTRPGEEKTLF